MASAAKEVRYQPGSVVYDNLARSLDYQVLEHDLRHAGEMPRQRETVKEQPKVRSAAKVQVRERQQVSLVTVAGFAAVIVMAVMVLMSYIQLTAISSDVVALQNELAALETAHVTLMAQHEQMFDLDTVKEAAEAAGMTKPGSSQIFYIDLSDGDSAVVYQQEDPGFLSTVMTSLHHGFYTVVEYFN